MRRNLLPVMALLLGTLFLFLGNGLHGLLLPVRGAAEGYSNEVLGLLGTTWAAGFVLGCFVAPKLVMRVGHVRAFSTFVSLISVNALLTGIIVDATWWVALRVITGFCTAGTSMIIESWLNERATNESRGMIFSFYISITLIGVVGGQMLVGVFDPATTILFMICGIVYGFAVLPTLMSTAASPQPLRSIKLDLPLLYRNSPVSFVGILLIGIANGAYGTLVAVFGSRAGLDATTIAILLSVTIFLGAVMQFPAGKLSDRIDRRYVLAALSSLAASLPSPHLGSCSSPPAIRSGSSCWSAPMAPPPMRSIRSPSPMPTTSRRPMSSSKSLAACCCSSASARSSARRWVARS